MMAAKKAKTVKTGGVAAEQLRSFIERIERLNEEKAVLANDIKEVFAEAKMNGFDTPAMRQIIKLRAMDASDRQEKDAILDLYKRALGMDGELPLFEDDDKINSEVYEAVKKAGYSPEIQEAFKKFTGTIPAGGSVTINGVTIARNDLGELLTNV